MIRSFRHKALGQLFNGKPKGINADLRAKVENILAVLDSADGPEGMNLPGFDLHELKGHRKGVWAVTVNKNWRITFRFKNGNAQDVNFEDYH
jgi:proteic killer suppression protein